MKDLGRKIAEKMLILFAVFLIYLKPKDLDDKLQKQEKMIDYNLKLDSFEKYILFQWHLKSSIFLINFSTFSPFSRKLTDGYPLIPNMYRKGEAGSKIRLLPT